MNGLLYCYSCMIFLYRFCNCVLLLMCINMLFLWCNILITIFQLTVNKLHFTVIYLLCECFLLKLHGIHVLKHIGITIVVLTINCDLYLILKKKFRFN